jgi:hypothetical protein
MNGKFWFSLVSGWLSIWPAFASPDVSGFFVSDAVRQYAGSPEWLALVHYQKSFGSYKGTIGSENFYLSPCGRHDPLKELDATIALFQSNDRQTQCRFPARYKRLKAAGLIDASFPICEEYEQFQKDLRPSGVTLLFTDAYMNNSSSLFGHTLLRIDTARKGTQLLAHGVNYGAYTKGYENTFLYAVYGLAGFYPAGLTTKPYYDVINTYNNLENRDIWEYNLQLSDEELSLFVAHLWEVGQTVTPYYFFSRNCSYMLMEIFDAVRPSLRLAADFPYQTIPLDTVKAVAARSGLVKSVMYRPSRQRKINDRIRQMTPQQYRVFVDLIRQKGENVSDLPDAQKADVLETAYQYVQYRYVAGDLDLASYRKESFRLLSARNRYASGQTFDDLKDGKNPLESHDSAEVAPSIGVADGKFFGQINVRPAYHSLNDRPYGFLQGAEINFLEQSWRYEKNKNRLALQRFDVLELASLSPITQVFQAPSYRIGVWAERLENLHKDKTAGHALRSSVAGGVTAALKSRLWLYALTSAEGAYGGTFRHNGWLGVGGTLGGLFQTDSFGIQTEIEQIAATEQVGTQTLVRTSFDYYLTRQTALEISYKLIHNSIRTLDETVLTLKRYF